MHILITGGAGFIGSHLAEKLIHEKHQVTIIDNFDPFYDPLIKRKNLQSLIGNPDFNLLEVDICDNEKLNQWFPKEIDAIVHLAAKAGVRPSISDPISYQETNVVGTQNLLELTRKNEIKTFIFGSSSSVYGVNKKVPW